MKNAQAVFLLLALALWLPLAAIVTGLAGCETGTTGFARPFSTTAEMAITNTIATAGSSIAATASSPWNTVAAAAATALLGLMTAWQAYTHKRLNTVINGNKPPPPEKTT